MQLIIQNAKIYNGQAFLPDHYHILIEDGIIRLLSRSPIAPSKLDSIIIDAHFRTVMPGLIEGHNHFLAHALRRAWIDLSDVDDPETGLEMIAEYAETVPENEWIRGGGWSFARWGRENIHKKYLDQIVQDKPIALESMDYHSIWINSKAQELLGIDPSQSSHPREEFGWDENGLFTGVLFENARLDVYEKIPAPSPQFLKSALEKNIQYYHQNGFTHVITMDGKQEMEWILKWINQLPMKFSWFFPYKMLFQESVQSIRKTYRTENLEPTGPKMFLDGAFGSLTAWVSRPYIGTNSCGIPVMNEEEVRQVIKIAHDNAFGVAVHAIGDEAIRQAVGFFEESFNQKKFATEYPNRLEHVQLPPDDIISKMSHYQLGVSIQPCHIDEDIPIIEQYLKDRKHLCYPFRKLELNHVPLIMSSDAPVKEINPFVNIYWAITQHDPEDKTRALNEREILTLNSALKGYTHTAALYSGFPDSGAIRQGYAADLVILNTDLSSIYSPDMLLETYVTHTIYQGEIVYQYKEVEA